MSQISWTLAGGEASAESKEEVKRLFGDRAIVTRVGRFNLIHLDEPSPEELARRNAEFDPEDYFEDDCPLCRMMKEQGGSVVYDDI